VQTDRTIPNKKPDIIIRDNERGTCMLIDVAIPAGRNVIKKEAKNILKYKDLIRETQRMWNVKTKVTPVIVDAAGTISKSFRKYLSSVSGKHDIKELQKTALLCTEHILRANVEAQKSLILKTALYACTMNSKHGIAASLYTPATWFVSGI
jgi:hypothetical protein